MSSKDGNTKTLRFPDEVHAKLCRVAHKHKKSKQQLFAQLPQKSSHLSPLVVIICVCFILYFHNGFYNYTPSFRFSY